MKLNSKILKEKIVDYIKSDPEYIVSLWDVQYHAQLVPIEELLKKANKWIRVSKEKDDDRIIRRFEPRSGFGEVDEQLVAYVETSLDDTKILDLWIEA